MGIFYYVLIQPDDNIKKIIKDRINRRLEKGDYLDAQSELQYSITQFNLGELKAHLGEACTGWKFRFNHNDCRYYELTRASISEFINKHTLISESGEIIDPSDFWKWIVDASEDGYTHRTYAEKFKIGYDHNPKQRFFSEFTNLEGLLFDEKTDFLEDVPF